MSACVDCVCVCAARLAHSTHIPTHLLSVVGQVFKRNGKNSDFENQFLVLHIECDAQCSNLLLPSSSSSSRCRRRTFITECNSSYFICQQTCCGYVREGRWESVAYLCMALYIDEKCSHTHSPAFIIWTGASQHLSTCSHSINVPSAKCIRRKYM